MEKALDEKTITKRQSILRDYLKTHNIGILNDKDSITFKHIFEKYYAVDEGEEKFNSSQICCVSIVKDKYNNKCFNIIVNDVRYNTSIKRLSGASISQNLNITRAMRYEIECQIKEFIENNPLDINLLCPITGYKLGKDAQVDHVVPFHTIRDVFLLNNKPNVVYDTSKFNYVIENKEMADSWKEYHRDKAVLRWLSKDGNKIAHHFYNP